MSFIDYIRTAAKNFARQKLRTFLTIVAITVGSISIILMASIIISIRQSLMDTFKKMGAFNLVTVTRDPNSTNDNPQLITASNNNPGNDEGKKIDDATIKSIKNLPNVVDATPVISVWAKTIRLEGQDKKMWCSLLSYQPDSNVFDMPLLAGRNLNNKDMDNIVVGSGFAQTYGYSSNPQDLIGKRVVLMYDSGGSSPDWGPEPQKPPMGAGKEWDEAQRKKGLEIYATIVGVADDRTMDSGQNYINIVWGRRLMTNVYWQNDEEARKQCEINFQQEQQALQQQAKQNNENYNGAKSNCDSLVTMKLMKEDNFTKNGYGSVIAKVNNTANVQGVADAIQKTGYGVTTAQNMIDQMNKIFALIGLVLSLIGGISLFVAAIGIINTMLMATFERVREIGVMRACGATRMTIRQLFTFEAAFLGFCGGVFGIIISSILMLIAKLIIKKFGASLGNIPLDQIGTFPFWLICLVIFFTTLIGLMAGLYPAVRASKLNPVEALRSE